jgi:hypothetical protein
MEMALAKDDHVVNAFPPDRPDQPLRISVLPRRPRGCGSIADAHGANTSDEYLTIGSITVTDEIAWSLVPSTGLSELPSDPLRGWMRRGPHPKEPPPLVPQDEKTIEKPERNRRHHEQVHRSNAIRMVAHKRAPALRRWSPPPGHVLVYGPAVRCKLDVAIWR